MALATGALTTVQALMSETGACASDADTLERLINTASARIAAYLNRTIQYESGITENVSGYGTTNLVVSRPPIVLVTQITLDGAVIDSDYYEINEPDAGLIFRSTGWYSTLGRLAGITQPPLPGTESPQYEVTYDGGWVTPQQVLDDEALPSPVGLVRTLPYDIEDACIQLAGGRYSRIGKDPTIASEKLMSYAVSFNKQSAADSATTRGMPVEVAAMLNAYASISQVAV